MLKKINNPLPGLKSVLGWGRGTGRDLIVRLFFLWVEGGVSGTSMVSVVKDSVG